MVKALWYLGSPLMSAKSHWVCLRLPFELDLVSGSGDVGGGGFLMGAGGAGSALYSSNVPLAS